MEARKEFVWFPVEDSEWVLCQKLSRDGRAACQSQCTLTHGVRISTTPFPQNPKTLNPKP